jgi:tRNA(Ile)-lysidine synthase
VATLAAKWHLPVTIEKRDVPAIAQKQGLAFEEAARRLRYAFLARVAAKINARKVAVGHNADDQAETVLMHFLRGAGLTGLRGMLPLTRLTDYRLLEPFLYRGKHSDSSPEEEKEENKERSPAESHPQLCIIRPLLEVSRSKIERYCAAQELTPRFDRSNLDTTYFRNRLRHELLPLLETYNPNIRDRLCHTASVVAADYELLSKLRERAWTQVVVTRPNSEKEPQTAIIFDRATWRALPLALQRATLRQATYRLRRSLRDVDFVHVENAREIGLNGDTGAQATLPMGLVLTVGYDTLMVGGAGDVGPPPDEPLLRTSGTLTVRLPGATPIPQSDWSLQTEILEKWDVSHVRDNPDPWMAYLDADRLAGPLVLRPRRPGDRFQPQGMGGHSVKVSAFMINLKIPSAWRDRVPLLVAGDQIVWVCGRRIGEVAAVKPDTRRVAKLWFSRHQIG